jgi:hypothetical protein
MLGGGGAEHLGAPGPHQLGAAIVNVGRGVEPDAGVAVLVVVPAEEPAAKACASWKPPKRSGNSGRYFMVRNWLSL